MIKERHPSLPIVFGGSSCSSELGNSLVQQFQQVDFVVSGEGESVLTALCRFLAGESTELPQHIYSKNDIKDQGITRLQTPLLKLNDLPRPDFDDYFKQMRLLFPQQATMYRQSLSRPLQVLTTVSMPCLQLTLQPMEARSLTL